MVFMISMVIVIIQAIIVTNIIYIYILPDFNGCHSSESVWHDNHGYMILYIYIYIHMNSMNHCDSLLVATIIYKYIYMELVNH